MMLDEIRQLVDQYQLWLRDRTTLRQVGDHVEVTTPYLDRHNDYLQIYAARANGGFVLTDDGYVLDDLRLSGCKLDSEKRQALLKVTLNGFGVQLNEGALEVHASGDNFAVRKHNLLQAMLAVNDLFYLATPIVTSLFLEDVVDWLDRLEVRYTPRVKFTGKTGYDHLFDFVIPKSRQQPERILRAINRPTKDAAQSTAFSWIDTKEVRPADSRAYALLNDSDREVSASVADALRSYEVKPVVWSRRTEIEQELAA
jgi:hypothetical protein